jgi:NAD(P)-dependent dehydrogenase (short-subunit alcohol dehydrogenase family)
MTIDLDGGAAVVTGAAGGLGLGIARAAAADGMSLVLSDIDAERLEAAAAGLRNEGHRAVAVPGDVTDPDAMAQLAAAATAEFGRIDLVCLNAGISPVALPITDVPPAVWEKVMAINLYGVVNGINAFLPVMESQGGGHINATASVNGHKADVGIAAYNASKFAVVGLMESLLVDLRDGGSPVTASVLCPGPIATDIIKRAVGEDRGKRDEEHALLNRGMQPDQAGRITIDRIKDGRFWIFTHDVMVDDTLRRRFEALAGDGSYPIDHEWDWEEILDAEE